MAENSNGGGRAHAGDAQLRLSPKRRRFMGRGIAEAGGDSRPDCGPVRTLQRLNAEARRGAERRRGTQSFHSLCVSPRPFASLHSCKASDRELARPTLPSALPGLEIETRQGTLPVVVGCFRSWLLSKTPTYSAVSVLNLTRFVVSSFKPTFPDQCCNNSSNHRSNHKQP